MCIGSVGHCPSPQVFDGSNWHVPQVVTVAAVDDDLVEPTQLMTRLTAGVVQSTDANYDALTDEGELWSAPVNVTSDDVGRVILRASLSASGAEPAPLPGTTSVVAEGGLAVLWVRLDTQPMGAVAVRVTVPPAGESQVVLSPALLRFTTASWDTWVPVLVAAVDDTVPEVAVQRVTVSASVSSPESLDRVYLAADAEHPAVGDAAVLRWVFVRGSDVGGVGK